MENILRGNAKFEKVDVKTRTFNFQVNHEKCINEILKSLTLQVVLVISNIRKLKPLDLDLVFYMAFVKFTKQLLMFVHLLELSCLQLGPTYKIAKFLVPILSCLTINEFTIEDFFICKRNC